MIRAVRMEWTKLRSVPSTPWSLLALVALHVVTGVLVLWTLDATHCSAPCEQDLPRLSLSGVSLGQLAVVTATVLGTGLLGVVGSLVAGWLVPVHGYPAVSLADGSARRAYLGTVLYLGLVALLSVGIGTLIRHTPGAISMVLALLYVPPIVAQLVTVPLWHDRISRYAPMAGLAVQATKRLDQLPIQPWTGLGVLAAYAGAALLLGGVVFKTRDA